jgi:hypothetical protein
VKLKREVAIKVLPDEFSRDSERLAQARTLDRFWSDFRETKVPANRWMPGDTGSVQS